VTTSKEEEIFSQVLDAAFKVHSELGPGLLEGTYQKCLAYELRGADLQVEEEKELPLIYGDMQLQVGYRVDLWVEDLIIVELKAVEKFQPVHTAQLLTYLKLAQLNLGLLANFNVKHFKDGFKRIIN
jgi:GxxExxY protein